MSELTRCNRCTLNEMKRVARRRGVGLYMEIINEPGDSMRGWIRVRYSDQTEASAYFLELTKKCVC